eukprot:TRINITY_DN19543_c0_g1_i3.p1 TRINITY_DN19543_c0_g1~~TRINITY_DN19543_c0_g1_i3.p1  ORF type:complete len:227 (+),score=60.14 TRINITY_DN19543_c0_g1_i3:154-834(+)
MCIRDRNELVGLSLRACMNANNIPAAAIMTRSILKRLELSLLDVKDAREMYANCSGSACSHSMLGVIGAIPIAMSVADGGIAGRCGDVVSYLDEWLARAGSLKFRFRAWLTEREQAYQKQSQEGDTGMNDLSISKSPVPKLQTFVTNQVTINRAEFRDLVLELEHSFQNNLGTFSQQLVSIAAQLKEPVLRLELMLYIVGADIRWSGRDLLESCELFAESVHNHAT